MQTKAVVCDCAAHTTPRRWDERWWQQNASESAVRGGCEQNKKEQIQGKNVKQKPLNEEEYEQRDKVNRLKRLNPRNVAVDLI